MNRDVLQNSLLNFCWATTRIFPLGVLWLWSVGCGMKDTKAWVVVDDYKTNGTYYTLLYKVIEPKNLAGRYGTGSTLRRDLLTNIDGAEYEVCFNLTMIGGLEANKPLDYLESRPTPGNGDFLDSAKRLK